MAGTAVNLYVQAVKIASFRKGAAIYPHIFQIHRWLKPTAEIIQICTLGFSKELLFIENSLKILYSKWFKNQLKESQQTFIHYTAM